MEFGRLAARRSQGCRRRPTSVAAPLIIVQYAMWVSSCTHFHPPVIYYNTHYNLTVHTCTHSLLTLNFDSSVIGPAREAFELTVWIRQVFASVLMNSIFLQQWVCVCVNFSSYENTHGQSETVRWPGRDRPLTGVDQAHYYIDHFVILCQLEYGVVGWG